MTPIERRQRREDRYEARLLRQIRLTEMRDAALWWAGVWAGVTLLDAAVFAVVRHVRRKLEAKHGEQE